MKVEIGKITPLPGHSRITRNYGHLLLSYEIPSADLHARPIDTIRTTKPRLDRKMKT